jgi:NadR type nicotinamide-nucleotide adenylyltransferase
MTTGLIIGKFYPPHKGHKLLIDTAIDRVNKVYVIVCEKDGQVPSGSLRIGWIKEWYGSDNIDIQLYHYVHDNDDPKLWADECKKLLNFIPNFVFTSELYGNSFAEYLGSKHVLIDLYREKIPISGTVTRNNPLKYLNYLEPNVRKYYIPRVVLVGAESTGKTTLAKKIMEKYPEKAKWVPEYMRILCEKKLKNNFDPDMTPIFIWTTDELIETAQGQIESEVFTAMQDNIEFIICDTDVFAVSIWHERYIGYVSDEIEKMTKEYEKEVYQQIYLLTDNSVPFIQDGYRDGEHIRDWMFNKFFEKLKSENKKFHLLTGSYDDRFKKAQEIIDKLIGINDYK